MTKRHLLLCVLVCALPPNLAAGQGGLSERQTERRKEGWYFSDHLSAKSQSARQDVLYRFYQSQNKKTRPRVEPFVFGLGSTAVAKGAVESPNVSGLASPARRAFTSSGFGGEVFFNHFVSGLLGVPTLNIVPGLRGERVEEPANPDNKVAVGWGPTVRLFGANAQDTALFLSYRNTRRSVLGEAYNAWHWQGGGRVYVLPALAAEGEGIFNESFLQGKASALARRSGWWAGGFVEFSVVRVGYRFSKEHYHIHGEDNRRIQEERRTLYLGLVY
jgi:hypothetical protein